MNFSGKASFLIFNSSPWSYDRHAKCTEQAERCSGNILKDLVNFWSENTRIFDAYGVNIL